MNDTNSQKTESKEVLHLGGSWQFAGQVLCTSDFNTANGLTGGALSLLLTPGMYAVLAFGYWRLK
jgi:hypothetical protein